MATRKSTRVPTPEQRAKAEARRERFTELARTIGAMSDEQRAALAASMATTVTVEGRGLSAHNACLVASQCPTATMVGGFNQWHAHGRTVRKGEHGLMIWAPARRAEDPQRQPDEVSSRDDRPRFIMVTVFDVAQTDALEPAVA